MRLIRHGAVNFEKPGVILPDGSRKDLSSRFTDWNSAFFEGEGLAQLEAALSEGALHSLPDVPPTTRWASPIPRPGKIVCIGLNYSDHARESGMAIPAEPIVFLKASNTACGPNDDVQIPRHSTKTDWEVELGIVIGRPARYCTNAEEANACIAGYCISHDVSERAFQLERGGQWTKGKSCDTFNPIGPWLATPDEMTDVQSLDMSLKVNDEIRQRGSTSTMIFGCSYLVHYLSQFMTLEPGDLISTGTPPGVGLGMKPPQFLKVGDIVELQIKGLGVQRQRFVSSI